MFILGLGDRDQLNPGHEMCGIGRWHEHYRVYQRGAPAATVVLRGFLRLTFDQFSIWDF